MLKNLKNNISEKKALKHNTIALMVIQVLNYVLPFITMPYVARIFDVEKFGLIFFAQVIMDYMYRFVMFGYDLSATREIAINSNNHKSVTKIFNSVIFSQLIFLITSFIILSLLILLIPNWRKDYLVYYLTNLSLLGSVLCVNWFYQGMARMKFITILNIISRMVSVMLIFLLIKKPEDYILYPLFNSLSMIFAGIISIIFVRNVFKIRMYLPKLQEIANSIKYSSQFFLTKVAIALYRSTNAFVLGLVVTTTAVAYYVAADKIFWAVFNLYNTFILALFPYMSKNKDIKLFKKLIKYLILLTIGASIILLIASKYIILIFYSDKYLEAVRILQIFSLSFGFVILTDTFGFPLLGAYGHVKETNAGYIIGGIYNVIGLIILYLSNCVNIYSVAILVSSTYLIMFLHRIYYINKYKLFNNKGLI